MGLADIVSLDFYSKLDGGVLFDSYKFWNNSLWY